MTDRYDDMRVSPDPSQADALRRRLHERLASASRDDRKDRPHLHPDARLDPQPDLGPMKEIHVSDDSPTNEGRNRRRLVMAAAAAVAVIGVTGIAVAVGTGLGDDETQSPAAATTATPATTVAPVTEEMPTQAPVEFTACVHPGPQVQQGTVEESQISLPDGEMTITRERGNTWQSTVRDVSEPRLDGTWYNSIDADEYTSPGGGPVTALVAWTHRIENDEGAWEGSLLGVVLAGDEGDDPLALALSGEGAYEGLTAVATIDFGGTCPNTRGYIIEGGVPAPPVPQTGQ